MKNYVGSICPYCKTEILDEDSVAFCAGCEMPHHLECWQENQGCTTYGCTGKIRLIIREGMVVCDTDNPGEVPYKPVIDKPLPAPSEEEKKPAKSKLRYVLAARSTDARLYTGLPLILAGYAVIEDKTAGKNMIQLRFRDFSGRTIKSLVLDIEGFDVNGNKLGEINGYTADNLNDTGSLVLGQKSAIYLPDTNIRVIKCRVTSMRFSGNTSLTSDGDSIPLPPPESLSGHFRDSALTDKYIRTFTRASAFVPVRIGNYFRCSCGTDNIFLSGVCRLCSENFQKQLDCLNPAVLAEMQTDEADEISLFD